MNSSEPRGHLTYIPGVGEVRVTLLANLEAAERRAIEAEGKLEKAREEVAPYIGSNEECLRLALKNNDPRRAGYFEGHLAATRVILGALDNSPTDPVEGEAQEQVTVTREKLERIRKAVTETAKALLVVQPVLSKPYEDDPRWSPWSRWIERTSDSAWPRLCKADTELRTLLHSTTKDPEEGDDR